ncbi:MAG: RIP metalloprotease RseP [Acidobacteria bacterium]|nr:RIP metalloprotease RseP [Acidobacteriota bacterium]
MPDILIVVLAVLFVLGVAINIHEFGHFIVAKLLGMRVEAYSFFGLGPRVWGFKKGHTDYRISAIPLGAYVKLYGDEATSSLEGGSSDGEKVPDSELYELRPRWQKFLVMLGGPFMNIVLALAIPFTIAMVQGVPSVPAPIVGFVKAGGAAEKAAIKVGDRIVAFDGTENPTWMRIQEDTLLLPEKEVPISVEREGKRVDLKITPSKITRGGNTMGSIDLAPDVGVEPVVVGSIDPQMPAAASGIEKGDLIMSVNDKPVRNSQEMKSYVIAAKNTPIKLIVNRKGERKEITTTAKQKDGEWLIGIGFSNNFDSAFEPVGIAGAAGFAVDSNWRILRLTGKAFGQMFSGERSVKEGGVAGPIGIVQIISQVVRDSGFLGLLPLLMVISLNLGVFNLLPIPMLDGGQIAVLGIEAVLALFGMTLSIAIKEKIQLVGLGLILLLMVLVMYVDISRLIG